MSLVALLALLACGGPCGRDATCSVASGEYQAWTPEGWDGEGPLPTVLFFHGVRTQPTDYLSADARTLYSEAGVLLVAPIGLDRRWSIEHMGLAGNGRVESDFILEVLDDVRQRWVIDEARIYGSGHSLGASLLYTLACEYGDQFAAVTPTSGGFWEPMPESCPSAALPVCHIHGDADTIWPVEGREVSEDGEDGIQAPLEQDIAFWIEHNGCDPEQTIESTAGSLSCTHWTECDSGVEVGRCMHAGGHEVPEDWVQRELEWMLRFPRPE